MKHFFLGLFFSLFLGITSVSAQVQLVSDYETVQPGMDIWVKMDIFLEKGAHTYGPNPGEVGVPISVKWDLPDGISLVQKQWGETSSFSYDGIKSEGYTDRADLYFQFHISDQLTASLVQLKGQVSYLECTDICIPKKEEITLSLPVTKEGALKRNIHATPSRISVWAMIVAAFLGGLILNIMPCVFPILSLKALHVLGSAGHPNNAKREGVGYTLGILIAFTFFGTAISALKWSGTSVGWGFQLQEPGFVFVLMIIMVCMGLFLQDGLPLPKWMLSLSSSSGQLQYRWSKERSAFWSSVMIGLLAAVVATPCTAPFMATALGFALTQPYWILMSIIWSVGLGLASPFILISFFPVIARRLPKAGPWLEKVKFYLAFPLYLTAVWLGWVFVQQMGSYVVLWLGWLGVVAWALVVIQRESWKIKPILSGLLVIMMIGIVGMIFTSDSKTTETAVSSFSEDAITYELSLGKSVLVDVTADWCLTCKVNERAVLNTKDIRDFFQAKGVTVIKADWTRYDASITAYLESFQRSGVPLYVAYIPGKEPIVLPQQLTAASLKSVFN